MKVDKELIEKYNVPVPRYTSYPPANHFTTDFSTDDYLQLIQSSNDEEPELIAFYIHIPFCQKICYYCGCNAIKIREIHSVSDYISAVKKEIELVTKGIDPKRKVSQIHYGGGTPNAIDASYLKELNQLLQGKFEFIENPEIAIECNPALLSYEYIDELLDAGFNRFSFGIQDFNEEVLKDVNRAPSAMPMDELVKYVKGKDEKIAVNLDFIYGLPGQTVESFSETIKKAIAVRPDRLVTFSYAHVPWMKEHQKILDPKGLPGSDEKTNMFTAAHKLMTEAGYKAIGLDHYALPEDELCVALANHQLHRNFQGYCTKRTTGQVFAFGVSGISQLSGGYMQNLKDLSGYMKCLNEGILPVEKGYVVTDEQKVVRSVINELMCNEFINWEEVAESFNLELLDLKKIIGYNTDVLTSFRKDGLIEFSDTTLKITEAGALFIRNVVSVFDPALKQSGKQYSKSL